MPDGRISAALDDVLNDALNDVLAQARVMCSQDATHHAAYALLWEWLFPRNCVYYSREAPCDMEQSEVKAIMRTLDIRRRAIERVQNTPPIGITLIAWFQFAKAAILLLAGTLLQQKPELINGPESPLYPLLYIATRGRYGELGVLQGGNALTELFLVLALYMAAIGSGLLSLSTWSRRTLILNCGLTLALSAKAILSPGTAASASLDLTNFYTLLALDACVFVYLLRGNTAHLFNKGQR